MEKSYRDLISRTEQETVKEELELRVEEAHQQLLFDRSATKRELLSAKKRLSDAESAYPFHTSKVVECEVEVEGLQDGLDRIDEIEKRLFPTE